MKPPLSESWDTLSDDARWDILNKTDLTGLQKSLVALIPFARIRSEWRDKLQEAWSKSK